MQKNPNPVDIHVGKRVRALRMARGMSQEGLAEHLAVTFQQVQKYEKGTNRISASRLFQISRVLEVDPGYFFIGLSEDGLSASPEVQTTTALMATRHGGDVARLWPSVEAGGRAGTMLDVLRMAAAPAGAAVQ